MKKLTALLLALTLLFSGSAALAKKPSAHLRSSIYKNQTVKRGSYIYWRFTLRSNSYTRQGTKWRSRFDWDINRKNASGQLMKSGSVCFSGNLNFRLAWKVPKTAKTGTYRVSYCALYRQSGAWHVANASYKKFFVK